MMDDAFVLEPEVWFAVICHGVGIDQTTGNINLQSVYNQTRFFIPPEQSGLQPHGHLQGVLAIGLTGGEGHFAARIVARDIDENVVWERPAGDWEFDVGLGRAQNALLGEEVSLWLPQPGRYHFLVQVVPGHLRFRIPFEVAEKIGPAERAAAQDQEPSE